MDKQDKTADTVRPINIKIFVSQHFAGLREFIKDDEIAEFYEELIVDTVLAFSAQHRTAELEAKIKALQERLEAADEVINSNDDYAANNTWVTNYEKALEKYQSIKLKK